MRRERFWRTMTLALVLSAIAVAGPATAVKLADAAVYIEINATDGDAGIHVFLDGEGWNSMQMISPNGVEFSMLADNSVGFQGITEFFFESAEPSFDEQPLAELLELFPAGKYKFRGTTTEGSRLVGKAWLTHALPDGPTLLFPVDGEEVDPNNAEFSWAPVADPPGSEIVGYEVIVGCEEPDFVDFSAKVGPDATGVTVPPEVLSQDGAEECKWEVLAVEESGNQTIHESEFSID